MFAQFTKTCLPNLLKFDTRSADFYPIFAYVIIPGDLASPLSFLLIFMPNRRHQEKKLLCQTYIFRIGYNIGHRSSLIVEHRCCNSANL